MFSTVTATRFPETVTAMTAVLSDSVAQSPLMSTFRPLLRCSRTVPDAGLSASVVVDATDGSVQVLVDGGEADPVHDGALEGGGLGGCNVGPQYVDEDDEHDAEDLSEDVHYRSLSSRQPRNTGKRGRSFTPTRKDFTLASWPR